MSVKSWHDSDDIDSDDESSAYNLLYKNIQSKNDTKSEIISNNIDNLQKIDYLQKIDTNINNYIEKNNVEENIIILSDSDDSFEVKKIICKNKISDLYVGGSSDDSEDSFFEEKNYKISPNFTNEIIVNVNKRNNQISKYSEEILENLKEIRNNLEVDDWSVDLIDEEPKQRSRNRYFEVSKSTVCEICLKKGHLTSECTRSGPACILCGKEGHISKYCDVIICHICFQNDHITKKCPSTAQFLRNPCRRCGLRGHSDQICPDIWRQYKYTLTPGKPVIQSCSSQNKKSVFCANCGRPGHFTEDCPRSRMSSKFIGPPPIMEIVRFDTTDIYKSYGLSYIHSSEIDKDSDKNTEDVKSMIMDMDVTGLMNTEDQIYSNSSLDQSCSIIENEIEIESRNFGDGYIMLSPVAKSQLLNKKNKDAKIKCSTPLSTLNNNCQPHKINKDLIDSSMPSLPESLLKTLFPDETNGFEKISPSLRAKLRNKLKNMLKNGYLPGDAQITQDRMEFWLQDVTTGHSLSYREKKKLLGSVSAALHSISDRVSNVTNNNNNTEEKKEFAIKTDLAVSRRKRNKNNREKKSLQNEIKELQKDNQNVSVDLTLDYIEDISLKARLRKTKLKKEGRRKRQKMNKSDNQLTNEAVVENVC